MNRREIALKTGIAGLILSLARPKAAVAQGGGGRSLEGAWRVSVTTGPGAPPNQPPQWETLITYAAGGTMLEYNGQPGTTPAHGAWKYSGRDEFEGTWFRFGYDPQGAVQVLTKVRSRIRMVSDNELRTTSRLRFTDSTDRSR